MKTTWARPKQEYLTLSNVAKELVKQEDGEESEEDASGTDDGEFSG